MERTANLLALTVLGHDGDLHSRFYVEIVIMLSATVLDPYYVECRYRTWGS